MIGDLITLPDIRAARERLAPHVRATPLLPLAPPVSPSRRDSPVLLLKAECLQVTGSFKVRAAFNTLLQLDTASLACGVVCASSGNFGQAVAYAAQRLGTKAVVVMERRSSPFKVEAIRRWSGEVVFCENEFRRRDERAEELRRERGLTTVHPFNRREVVAGNGTLGLEIVEALPDAATILVPVSGSGLIAGIATAVKLSGSKARVIGVQAEASNAAERSFRKGEPVEIPTPDTIADGLRAARPGDIPFAHVKAYVDDFALVSEDEIKRAVVFLFREAKLVVEPSGAVGVAAVLAGKVDSKGPIVAVLSGGNVGVAAMAGYAGSA